MPIPCKRGQGRQHLGNRQGLGHAAVQVPGGPRRDGVRTQAEASDREAHPWERNANPRPQHVDGRFRQPTDVTWDPQGNIYIVAGYVNARVAKYDKNGDWVKSGSMAKAPASSAVHSIAADAQGLIYVGDRNNRRIQVFDGDGNLKRDQDRRAVRRERETGDRQQAGSDQLSADRRQLRAWCAVGALHHAGAEPGALQLRSPIPGVSTSSAWRARCWAISAARASSPSSSMDHEIACPSENELYVAEILNWRVQKLMLQPDRQKAWSGAVRSVPATQ